MTEKVTVPRDQWEWFGSVGHCIVGRWCRFHLTTQVGPWIVSTIGEYVHPRHGNGSETLEAEWLRNNWPGEDIGSNRKYETMVFRVGGLCSCGCGQPEASDWAELDSRGYNDAKTARAGHIQMCEEWATRTAS